MDIHAKLFFIAILGSSILLPASPLAEQDASEGLKARTLFYNPGPDEKPQTTKRPSTRKPQPAGSVNGALVTTSPATTEGTNTLVNASLMTPVQHLGVRYNLVLVDDNSVEKPVDTARTFHQGDCLSLRVEANRAGYLYVIEQGSSGKWDVLLPSSAMTGETNAIRARTVEKIPTTYCFSVDASPGIEHVYLIFSRNEEDVRELNSIVTARQSSTGNTGAPSSKPAIDAAEPVTRQMAVLRDGLQGRDLTIKKIATPMDPGEPANSVYVVNTSDTPTDRLITEIQLRHQ